MAGIRALAPEDNYHFREVAELDRDGFRHRRGSVSGLIFGLAPALGASAANLQETLTQDGRAG